MTDDKESLEQLARRSETGDRAAFGELLDHARGQLEAWIRLRLGVRLRESVEPDDIVQETMLRALSSMGGFQWQGEKAFSNWLVRIAENVVQEHVRRAARQGVAPLADEPSSPAVTPSRADRRDERFERLQAALDTLDPVSRRVVELSRLEGLPLKEIAAIVGRSPNAVALVLMRALREMKKHVGDTESLGLPGRALRQEKPLDREGGPGDPGSV